MSRQVGSDQNWARPTAAACGILWRCQWQYPSGGPGQLARRAGLQDLVCQRCMRRFNISSVYTMVLHALSLCRAKVLVASKERAFHRDDVLAMQLALRVCTLRL
jgi:hypothetical protein